MDLAPGSRVFFTARRGNARHPGLVTARYPESAAEIAAATTPQRPRSRCAGRKVRSNVSSSGRLCRRR
jgi:hypothetical protein